MKRQPPSPYADSNMNSYAGSHMQQQVSGQRMRHNQTGMSNYSGRTESYSSDADHSYKSPKVDGQWQWDGAAQNVSNQMPSHRFNEGQGGNGARSYYHAQTPDLKQGLENEANKEARAQPREQDMEAGYKENMLPLTFEGLERKFRDDVMKLAKELSNTEDAENARHREKITEINTRYQEKLSALRAQQANRREELLHQESQARFAEYQQAGTNNHPNRSLQDARGYNGASVAGASAEAHPAYPTSQFDFYRDRAQFVGGGRTQGTEGRVPYPEGRVYNNAGGRYYQS